jgi:hypothetical protein
MDVGEEETMVLDAAGGAVHHLAERLDALVISW